MGSGFGIRSIDKKDGLAGSCPAMESGFGIRSNPNEKGLDRTCPAMKRWFADRSFGNKQGLAGSFFRSGVQGASEVTQKSDDRKCGIACFERKLRAFEAGWYPSRAWEELRVQRF